MDFADLKRAATAMAFRELARLAYIEAQQFPNRIWADSEVLNNALEIFDRLEAAANSVDMDLMYEDFDSWLDTSMIEQTGLEGEDIKSEYGLKDS